MNKYKLILEISNNHYMQKITTLVDTIFPPEYFENYTVKKIVGKGSYGHVAKAIRKNQQMYVAIKKITNLFNSLPETRRILRQLVLLKNCDHQNIVHMIDVIIPKNQTLQNFTQVYIVTEYCDSDLQKVFKSDGNFFEIGHVRSILYQILCGIKYLHSANIIHRDLKPANVLINSKGLAIKICDFGLSRAINQEDDKQSSSDQDHVLEIEQKSQRQQRIPQKAPEQPAISENGKTSKKKGTLKRQNTKTLQVPTEEDQKEILKIKKKQTMTNPNVKLTLKVTTRWYRAPQVILLDKDYYKPIDIWSVGCIFGELLKMQRCVCADSLQRFPLFPGKYCYPVSPNTLGVVYKNGYPQGRNDQLFMILSAIGKPTEQQMSFLTDEKAKQYIRRLETVQRKSFEQMFPKVDKAAIDLLRLILKFNPSERLNIDEIMSHNFFQPIRNKAAEKQRDPILMNPAIQDEELTLDQLRKCFVKELASYF